MTPSPWQRLAAAALHVERKAASLVAALARRRRFGEELADRREESRVGRRIAARRAADRALVDADHLVDMLESFEHRVRRRLGRRTVQVARDRGVQRVVDQCRLARARDAGDAGQQADRQIQRDALEIVAVCADQLQPVRERRRAVGRDLDLALARHVLAGQRLRIGHDLVERAASHHFAAVRAGARSHVDDVVRGADCILVVLHDDDAVAEIAQVLQRPDQPVVVTLVQSDRRFVQHVHHTGQAGPDLRREADALRLSARERVGGAIQRQVVQSDVDQEMQRASDLLDDLATRSPSSSP